MHSSTGGVHSAQLEAAVSQTVEFYCNGGHSPRGRAAALRLQPARLAHCTLSGARLIERGAAAPVVRCAGGARLFCLGAACLLFPPPPPSLLPLKNNIISSKLGFLRSNEIRLKPTLGNTCLDKDRGRVGEGGRWEGAGKLGGAVSLVFLGHKQQQRRVFTGEQTGR